MVGKFDIHRLFVMNFSATSTDNQFWLKVSEKLYLRLHYSYTISSKGSGIWRSTATPNFYSSPSPDGLGKWSCRQTADFALFLTISQFSSSSEVVVVLKKRDFDNKDFHFAKKLVKCGESMLKVQKERKLMSYFSLNL